MLIDIEILLTVLYKKSFNSADRPGNTENPTLKKSSF